MVSDEEIEKFLEDKNSEKTELAADEIDESASRQVSEMAYIWNAVMEKLKADNFCFECHKKIVDEEKDQKEPIRLIIPKKVEPGVVAFCSVCKSCYEKLKAQQEVSEQKKEDDKDAE